MEYRSKSRGHVRAVDGVDLAVEAGEVVGLVGESGCGKSSLARVAAGLGAPASGQVIFDGEPLTPVRWRRRPANQVHLQMVFQDPYASLNPRRTIGAQLADGLADGRSGTARRTDVADLLDRVGMPASAAQKYPHQFSGGQRQRMAIARALAGGPRMLIADEPVTALDASAHGMLKVRARRSLRSR